MPYRQSAKKTLPKELEEINLDSLPSVSVQRKCSLEVSNRFLGSVAEHCNQKSIQLLKRQLDDLLFQDERGNLCIRVPGWPYNVHYPVLQSMFKHGSFNPKHGITVYAVWTKDEHKLCTEIATTAPKPSSSVVDAMQHLHATCIPAFLQANESKYPLMLPPRPLDHDAQPYPYLIFAQSSLEENPALAAAAEAAAGAPPSQKKSKKQPPARVRVHRIVSALKLDSYPVAVGWTLSNTIASHFVMGRAIKLDDLVFVATIGQLLFRGASKSEEAVQQMRFELHQPELIHMLRQAYRVRLQHCPCIGNSYVREWQMQQVGQIVYTACEKDGSLVDALRQKRRSATRMACTAVLCLRRVGIPDVPSAMVGNLVRNRLLPLLQMEVRHWFHKNVAADWMNCGIDFDPHF